MHESIDRVQDELEQLCQRHRVQHLALFGSALRDDFDEARSDIDFVVEFKPMSPVEHKRAYFGLLSDLEELFGRPVDLLEFGAIRNPYLKRSVDTGQETIFAAA